MSFFLESTKFGLVAVSYAAVLLFSLLALPPGGVNAANPNPILLNLTGGDPARGGALGTVSIELKNPSNNQFGVTSFLVHAPLGWTLSGCFGGPALQLCSIQPAQGIASYTGTGLHPNATMILSLNVTAPTGVYPLRGTFTSDLRDASGPSLYSGPSFTITAISPDAGKPNSLKVAAAFDSLFVEPVGLYVTGGAVAWLDISLVDSNGLITANFDATPILVNLTENSGNLTSHSAIISHGGVDSRFSSGNISWVLPVSVGKVSAVRASGVVRGIPVSASVSVEIIDRAPSISMLSPLLHNGTLTTTSTVVQFSGTANVSKRYPASVAIDSLSYRVDAGPMVNTTIVSGSSVNWQVSVSFAPGYHTVQFAVSDSTGVGVLGNSATSTVLVSVAAPPPPPPWYVILGILTAVSALVALAVLQHVPRPVSPPRFPEVRKSQSGWKSGLRNNDLEF